MQSKRLIAVQKPSLLTLSLGLTCGFAIVALAVSLQAQTEPSRKAESGAGSSVTKSKAAGKVLCHAVFFKFKDSASAKDIDSVVAAFRALPAKLDVIKDFQMGMNKSRLGVDDGFTHCFVLTFKDEEGRAAYLPHAEHKAFGDLLRPYLDKVFVIDYWGAARSKAQGDELKHMAFIKFKDTVSPAELRVIEEAIAVLPAKIDTIKTFEWGTNNSPEKHDDGFTHAIAVTFDSEAALDMYMSHPEHEAFVQKVAPFIEKLRVLDFMAKKDDATATK